jgi:ornithine cyclodeaminase/alanine dehydrogenase-like protein (mu-crystallin family)
MSVLRLSKEPFIYFDEMHVHHLLTQDPLGFFQYTLKMLNGIANGTINIELPGKRIFFDPATEGDFRVMPCIVREKASVTKTVKLVGTNTVQKLIPDQITVGKACVIHSEENYISHIFEACLLSSGRTGICSMIGIELLAKRRERLAIIGAGRVGYYTGFYAAALGGVKNIYFSDISNDQADICASILRAKFPKIEITACEYSQIPDVDVLILATTSKYPICKPEASNPALIISVGADTNFQSELDPDWAGQAKLFLESFDSLRYGDLRAWIAEGKICQEELIDIFSLLNKTVLLDDADDTRIFVSTGTALFDNIAISYMLTQADNPDI